MKAAFEHKFIYDTEKKTWYLQEEGKNIAVEFFDPHTFNHNSLINNQNPKKYFRPDQLAAFLPFIRQLIDDGEYELLSFAIEAGFDQNFATAEMSSITQYSLEKADLSAYYRMVVPFSPDSLITFLQQIMFKDQNKKIDIAELEKYYFCPQREEMQGIVDDFLKQNGKDDFAFMQEPKLAEELMEFFVNKKIIIKKLPISDDVLQEILKKFDEKQIFLLVAKLTDDYPFKESLVRAIYKRQSIPRRDKENNDVFFLLDTLLEQQNLSVELASELQEYLQNNLEKQLHQRLEQIALNNNSINLLMLLKQQPFLYTFVDFCSQQWQDGKLINNSVTLRGAIDCSRWLVETKDENTSLLINQVNKTGQTPLMYIAACGTQEMISTLLSLGADRKIKDRFGKNAENYAELGNQIIIYSLINDVSITEPPFTDINDKFKAAIKLVDNNKLLRMIDDGALDRVSNECKTIVFSELISRGGDVAEAINAVRSSQEFDKFISNDSINVIRKNIRLFKLIVTNNQRWSKKLFSKFISAIALEGDKKPIDSLFVKACLDHYENDPSFNAAELGFTISLLSEEEWLKVSAQLIAFPHIAKKLMPHISKLVSIQFKVAGVSKDAFSILAAMTIRKFPKNVIPATADWVKSVAEKSEMMSVELNSAEPKNIKNFLEGYEFFKPLGRTLIFKSKNVADEYLALKVQKKDELPIELCKEYQFFKEVNKRKETLKLESDFPEPIDIISCQDIEYYIANVLKLSPEEQDEFREMIFKGIDEQRVVYVYKAKASYFKYLPDLEAELEDSKIIWGKAIRDLMRFIKEGVIFHELGQAWHISLGSDRLDLGIYLALANLIRGVDFSTMYGGGRLREPLEAVKYLNLREAGIADPNHITTESILNENTIKAHLREAFLKHGNVAPLYVFANYLAEYLLIVELALGKQANEQGGKRWEELKELLTNLYSSAFAELTGIDLDTSSKFFNSIADFSRYAEQMKYFMTKEYVTDFNKGEIRKDIYSEKVDVQLDNIVNNDGVLIRKPIIPFGNDLGQTNGPYPIKDGERLRNLLATFSLSALRAQQKSEDIFQTVEKDLEKIKSTNTSVNDAKKTALLNTAKHAFELGLGFFKPASKRRHQIEEKLLTKYEQAQRERAAKKIGSIWKDYKLKKQSSMENEQTKSEKKITPEIPPDDSNSLKV